MFPSSKIMKIEKNLRRWGKRVGRERRNKVKCFPGSTRRLKDNAILLIGTQHFEEVATRKV